MTERVLFALAIAMLHEGCSAPNPAVQCDARAFAAIRLAHADRTEVTVCGTVQRPGYVRRSRSGRHRTFTVDAGANGPVEIDANLEIMGDIPLRRGESAIVRGEYFYDPSGHEGVHWTHRTLRGSHLAGFIVLDGMTYQ